LSVLVNDATEKHATVVSINGEVVSLPQVLQTLVLPMPSLANETVLLYRPPATFRAGLTERKQTPFISFIIFARRKLLSKSFSYVVVAITIGIVT
jgi:hypothetical protein